MKTNKFFLLLMLLTLISCGDKSQDKATEVVVYNPSEEQLPDIFKSIEFLRLEYSSDVVIGNNPDMFFDKDDIYVFDRYGSKVFYRFNQKGDLKNKIGRIGRGPGEYTNVFDYNLQGDQLYVYTKSGDYTYLVDGTFIEKRENKISYKSIIKDGDKFWYYVSYKNNYGTDRLLQTDASRDIIQGFLPSDANVLQIKPDSPLFVKCNNEIYLQEELVNKVYSLNNDKVAEFLSFDFGVLNVPDEYFKQGDAFAAAELLFNRDYANLRRFFINEDYMVVMAQITKGDKNICSYGIKNISTDEWKWYDIEADKENFASLFAFSLRGLTPKNELVFTIDPLMLKKIADDNIPNDLFTNKPLFSEKDNQLVFKCKLK